MSLPRLCERFPRLRLTLARAALGTFPTPVHPLPALSREAGIDLWVKRDDLTSPRHGGNKVRKLELLFGDLLARGAERFLVYGPVGSNYVLSALLHGRALGLCGHAALFARPLTAHGRENLALTRAVAATVADCSGVLTLPWAVARQRRIVARATGAPPYLMPFGGTSALSTIGYVEAGLELAAQSRAGLCPEFERVIVPLGTAGTAAGLAVGLGLAGARTSVLAVRVNDRILANGLTVRLLAHRVISLLARLAGDDRLARARPAPVEVEHGFFGRGYAIPSPEGEAAIARVAAREGLALDSTYTGKTAAAILAARSLRGPRAEGAWCWWFTLPRRGTDVPRTPAGLQPPGWPDDRSKTEPLAAATSPSPGWGRS
ncbi:MAG: pyridoxal-phosphate dependent enzyme [Planctomycetes bacterium]|nr:pyridoxal-phosphate dependent enzyme [Planctomycetota bacterium]